ncbi:MAG TPA: RagB/SusD family nutrient uptake outer membrane protein [Gemmatirosa sp.]
MTTYRTVTRAATAALAAAIGAGALGLAGCKDATSLHETAQTFISPDRYYKSDAEASAAVNGAYAPLMSWNGWKSPAQFSVMCDDNEMTCWNWMAGGWSGNQGGQWYMQDNSVYIGDYQMIERANEVLANVPGSSGISAAEKKLASGQAYFIRGYAYFDLVRRYGGVPIRTKAYVPDPNNGALARSDPATVWQQAASDLRQATTMLPATYSNPNGQGLPRLATAWGLLAKVYLHMAGDEATGTALAANKAAYLDSARSAAQQEMGDPSVSLESNYMSLYDINKQNTSPEILFAVQGAAVNNNGSQIPAYLTPAGDCTLVGGCGDGFLSIREDFYRGFERGDVRVAPNTAVAMSWEYTRSAAGKIRVLQTDSLAKLKAAGLVVKDTAFSSGSWTEGCAAFGTNLDSMTIKDPSSGMTSTAVYGVSRPFYSLKYVDPQHLSSDQAAANNFIILRHADVLLVFAEAENEVNGPTAAAYSAINQVRARAGLAPLAGLGQAQFRQAVWTEREHELYAEFQARFDLVREGRWLTVMNAPSPIADLATGACRPRQAFQKLQNIPSRELAANPLMTQNPGY